MSNVNITLKNYVRKSNTPAKPPKIIIKAPRPTRYYRTHGNVNHTKRKRK